MCICGLTLVTKAKAFIYDVMCVETANQKLLFLNTGMFEYVDLSVLSSKVYSIGYYCHTVGHRGYYCPIEKFLRKC